MDIAVPLLQASQQVLEAARLTENDSLYGVIDQIDQQIFAAYGIDISNVPDDKADSVHAIIFDFRNDELLLSECLNMLEQIRIDKDSGG
jgi:hypothetical protein